MFGHLSFIKVQEGGNRKKEDKKKRKKEVEEIEKRERISKWSSCTLGKIHERKELARASHAFVVSSGSFNQSCFCFIVSVSLLCTVKEKEGGGEL